MSQNDGNASHDELIQNYLENEATPTEERQFRRLLGDESFRRRVAEYAIDLGHLHEHARQGRMERVLTARRRTAPRARRRMLAVAAAAATVLIVVGTVRHLSPTVETLPQVARDVPTPVGEQPTVSPERAAKSTEISSRGSPASPPASRIVVARVTGVTGRVLTGVGSGSTSRIAAEKEVEFCSGDMLQTIGADAFAYLKFDDDSVLAVAGDTELTCSIVDSQKKIDVSHGDIMAQVTPQPDRPMVIKTQVAEAEVVGTRLSLFTNLALTELAVMQGHVRFQRLSDDQTIDVREGECAIASNTAELVAKPISPMPSVWEEDFEQKWPERWRAGHWIHYALPPGSKGAALAAAHEEGGGPCFISSPNEWSRGLFRIDEDSHLNLTYKLKTQGWFYIMVETRSDDHSGEYRGNYLYQTPEIWKTPPRHWRTVSIPLAEFHVPQRRRLEGASPAVPKVGDVVFALFLRTQERDPGLFVDRIWVTKGPAEGAELLETP